MVTMRVMSEMMVVVIQVVMMQNETPIIAFECIGLLDLGVLEIGLALSLRRRGGEVGW